MVVVQFFYFHKALPRVAVFFFVCMSAIVILIPAAVCSLLQAGLSSVFGGCGSVLIFVE